MPALTPTELRSKLAYEYELIASLRSPAFGPVRGYASMTDARAGRELSPAEAKAGRPAVYDITYRFAIPVSPECTTDQAVAHFDLLGGGNFPFSLPIVTVRSRPMPFSPHVHPTSGIVCLGEGWERARGQMLAAQLVVHVMHLLNLDEPRPRPSWRGFSAEAAEWWRARGCRPFNADLEYPVLDPSLTHGVAPSRPAFRVCATVSPVTFRPAESRSVAFSGSVDPPPAFQVTNGGWGR